ncbi:hypothetical protein D3C85_1885480 [compost metagenome]
MADQRDDPDLSADHAVFSRHLHQPDLPRVVDDSGAVPVVGGVCGVVERARRNLRKLTG